MEKMILSSFRAGIVAMYMDGTIAYINPIGKKILEGSPLKPGESIHDRAGENSFFRVLSESIAMNYLPTRLEVDLPGKDGERQFLGFTLSELKEGKKKIGICAFFKDLTHVEMAEENENLKQRLLLLGQMAAGLAHEIRNPIASIGVHCGILRSHISGDEKLKSSVGMISQEIGRVEYIIRECLNFVRPAELSIRTIVVDRIVEQVVQRIQAIHPGMEFRIDKPKDKRPAVEADEGLLEQAIANILINAAEACNGKGKVDITIRTARYFSDRVDLNRRIETILPASKEIEKEFVRISINDDGPGIPLEIQDRIFVPFFTTKKTGTGIGLPMAQKIVHVHGGILDLRSIPGKGTEFILKIPARQKSGG
ncbi:MAG: hypothetical protein HY896_05280 [Deltaproteobacteria bacterium]|nr:hypothetical protein [Deltaproteobacteria bacterium]